MSDKYSLIRREVKEAPDRRSADHRRDRRMVVRQVAGRQSRRVAGRQSRRVAGRQGRRVGGRQGHQTSSGRAGAFP
jgi:hypothetical protein